MRNQMFVFPGNATKMQQQVKQHYAYRFTRSNPGANQAGAS